MQANALRHRAPFAHRLVPSKAARRRLRCVAQDKAPVRIRVVKEVGEHEQIRAVGNVDVLGSWQPDRAPTLQPLGDNVWALELTVPCGQEIEFKLVRTGGQDTKWEDGDNRRFSAWGPSYSLDVSCIWGKGSKTKIHAEELRDGKPVFHKINPHGSQDGAHAPAVTTSKPEAQQEQQRRQETQQGGSGDAARQDSNCSRPSTPDITTTSDEDAPAVEWQGRDITFMQSNEHSRERSGVWDASGLEGAEAALVKGDQKAANWLSKLGLVKQVLVDDCPRLRPGQEQLAAGYVYLQWVATGAVPCVEGGGHHRPNHHANLAKVIFRSLEWVIGEDTTAQRVPSLLARRCSAKLPSFGEAFTQSVPLTRIRDIAHRNDIPSDLKREIKHTLQNKLHRNAGPEDLIATEAMLKRITANPGEYNDAFIAEFKLFAAELRDFFNAGSLTTLLDAIRPALGAEPENAQLLDLFYSRKAKLDELGANATAQDLMDVMHSLTGVRAVLLGGLSSGLRNDAPDASMAMRQRWRLAETRCEDYFFTLLSRFINAVEQNGGSNFLSSAHEKEWGLPIGALVLALRQLGLSGWQAQEIMAIEREIEAWQRAGQFQEKPNALRLKASLERVQRTCGDFTEALLEALPPVAGRLGKALGVQQHVISTFTEAEVRASVVFQLSKLAALMLRAARGAAGVSQWDSLVAGIAVGRLVDVPRIDPASLANVKERQVLLVRSADGDEEVGAAGSCVAGVVLTQELPHLSHLGVRARQERVPFATLEDEAVLHGQVEPLLGKIVALEVRPGGVTLREATLAEAQAASGAAAPAAATNGAAAGNGNGNGANGNGAAAGKAGGKAGGKAAAKPGQANLVTRPRLVDLPDCTPELSGAKAAACARLEQVARKSKGRASFKTPRGACLPFGTMQLALHAAGSAAEADFAAALTEVQNAPLGEGESGRALEAACNRLQALVGSLRLPDKLAQEVGRRFGSGSAALMARSSANVEDLQGMSGAGLYESIANVSPSDPEALSAAVAQVWASLYSRRAVLSRRAAGVKQADAVMCVLLQDMLAPSASFVLHTASPLGDAPGTAVVEIASGLGETLASGMRGSPWRLAIDKKSGSTKTLAFANFSQQLLPAGASAPLPAASAAGLRYVPSPASSTAAAVAERPASPGVAVEGFSCRSVVVDYSTQQLSISGDARDALGRRIGAIAALLESEFGGPQDVEGCIVGDDIYVVQTRPQPL